MNNYEQQTTNCQLRATQTAYPAHLANNELLTSIDNPTLAHFRHFSSLFTNFPSTFVVSALQIAHFMQNKPNFQKAQMNVSRVSTRDYAKWTLGQRGKNKPNSKPIQTQTKPISNAKNNPAGSKKKALFGVASIIRENKMLTDSFFGEIMKFLVLMKVLRFLHVSERVKL